MCCMVGEQANVRLKGRNYCLAETYFKHYSHLKHTQRKTETVFVCVFEKVPGLISTDVPA